MMLGRGPYVSACTPFRDSDGTLLFVGKRIEQAASQTQAVTPDMRLSGERTR
jgi:hypothetical protein